jgi:hypothetical protein
MKEVSCHGFVNLVRNGNTGHQLQRSDIELPVQVSQSLLVHNCNHMKCIHVCDNSQGKLDMLFNSSFFYYVHS